MNNHPLDTKFDRFLDDLADGLRDIIRVLLDVMMAFLGWAIIIVVFMLIRSILPKF